MVVLAYDGIQRQHDTALTAFASPHQNKATQLSACVPMETTAFTAAIQKRPMNREEWVEHYKDDISHRIDDKTRGAKYEQIRNSLLFPDNIDRSAL